MPSVILGIVFVLATAGASRGSLPGDEPVSQGAVSDTPWTFLIYAAVDNDWERPFMRDLRGVLKGLRGDKTNEVILLIDRSPRYSRDKRALGEDFSSTRLYRLSGGQAVRLQGDDALPMLGQEKEPELNMGAGETLRQFIRFGKEHYPSRHTALLVVSHGEGMSCCPDETDDDDQLFTAELSDALGESESVDVLGLDACLMGGAENAYQWRPGPGRFGARYLVASAPVSSSWPYAEIFEAVRRKTGRSLTPQALSRLIVDQLADQIRERRSGDRGLERDLQAWGAFDLTRVADLKAAVDRLATALWAESEKADTVALRGAGLRAETFVYVWPERGSEAAMPHVDIAHLAERISKSGSFSTRVRTLAAGVVAAADRVVLHSVGFDHYKGFKGGRHGLYFVFPDGDKQDRRGRSYWSLIPWYDALRHEDDDRYGAYGWCLDGSIPGNGKVETWFELMDAWFDRKNSNSYRW